ncbi:hypothetical protein BTM29_03490 [Companilactobacillus allii]|uniref:Peptidase M20 dimerisation domain-containing protein n=1 Tax=Companilactobacillus allii TaxID=1847728 RepID=A0A1P8Q636_9LACO|nr:hypothetical protein BTM29_03490 [Companilactobacillus allii]
MFKELISDKGISATGEGINETVNFLTGTLEKLLGANVEVIETAGSPTILADIKGNASETVLFYGHYDVMTPGNIEDWHTDPFVLTEKDNRFFGRGVGDNKGQLLAQILGMYSYKKVNGNFPFNIKFLIEGEEEQGSKNLPITVKKLADNKLKDVDFAIVVDGSFNQSGQHVLRLGNRGALGFEITATTGTQDNHSGNLGNIMQNPILVLMGVVQKMYDLKNKKVLIPNYYRGVNKPDAKEIAWMKKLPFDKSSITEQTGVKTLPATGLEYYEKLMFQPTFNIAGINSGYSEKGIKTIIPNQAIMKLDLRLVGDQDVYAIKKSIDELLETEINSGLIKINYLVTVPPCKTDSNNEHIASIVKAIKAATGSDLIEPVMPGTVPNYVWGDILKVDSFTIPYANFDQHNHAPNENLTQSAFYSGIKTTYELLNSI